MVMFPLLLLSCSGGSSTPEPASPPPARPSLVLITLDTTRADHIGAYGHEAARTPTIDRLAGQGVRFDRAYATVPLTIPSHSSIFSGLYPTRHGVHTNGDAVLGEDVVTLAEHLKGAGYRTGAFVSAFVTSQVWGFNQGFDFYSDETRANEEAVNPDARWAKERPAEETINDAIAWLSERGEDADAPFFIWVHLFDAHDPYAPPPAYREAFPESMYDGEIAYMDDQLARLEGAVQDATGGAGAAWILVGDHGEALTHEHGERSHGLFLFDPTMRVPFILSPADPLPEPRVARGAVTVADVTPTALGMLGLPVPDGLDGVDLSPELSGETVPRRAVYMESYTAQQRFDFHPELAMARGDHKLMATPDARLYDLATDPGETVNRLEEEPALVGELRTALEAVEAQMVEAESLALSPELADRLASLGYMAGSHTDPAERSSVDAKLQLELLAALEEARMMRLNGASAQDLAAAYQAILTQHSSLSEAQIGLARALQRMGRPDDALAMYDEALQNGDASSTVLQLNRANLLAGMGRKDEALAAMEGILTQVPRDDLARAGTLKLLMDTDRKDEAEQRVRAWIADEPNDPTLQAFLGILLCQRGAMTEAKPLLEASLSDRVPRQLVHRMLAQIAVAENQPRVAASHLRQETEFFPANAEARMSLGNILMRLEDWEEAAAEFDAILTRNPNHLEARRGRAQAYFNLGDYDLAAEVLAPALETAPEDPLVLLLQANILAKQGKQEEAQAIFDKAQAIRARTPASTP